MSVLEKNLECFFNNDKIYENKEFKAYFYYDDNKNEFKIIYDDKNYIHYLLNIPKEKEYIIREKIEYEIMITDSLYDILFYKNSQNTICCILILIINDIEYKITNENYLEFQLEQFQNLNDNSNIISKIKQKVINYINEQKEKDKSVNIESILLGGKAFNLLYNKDLTNNESIKHLTSILSKIEIKIDSLNDNINDSFMNIYEILSPSYKSLLCQKYLDEIPNNLYDLMIKDQNIYITKNLYNQYTKIKYPKVTKNNKFKMINIKQRGIIKNKNKIVFHLDKDTKKDVKKKRFKIIFRKNKIANKKKRIELKVKRNIFQVHRNNNNDEVNKQIILENKSKIERQDNKDIININKTKIFKCVYPKNEEGKKYPFLINK